MFSPDTLPRPGIFFRRRQVFGLVLVVALGFAVALGPGPWLFARLGCSPGAVPTDGVWSQGHECVGQSAGPYYFDRPELQQAFATLDHLNTAANASPCHGTPATVGVLMTLTSDNAIGRAQHELEGFIATQAAANEPSACRRPVKLLVGQTGATEQAAVGVANRLADSGVVALVGMGLSDQQTAAAVKSIADRPKPVPMVADLVSAEGFDWHGSIGDSPNYADCDDSGLYSDGVGKGWFFRVGYRNNVQVQKLADWAAGTRVGFMIEPTSTADPATCTEIPDYRKKFDYPRELIFDHDNSDVTFDQATNPICQATGKVGVIYSARGLDLGKFLDNLDKRIQQGGCTPEAITVLAGSDSVRLRAEDPDVEREAHRLAALRSPSFREGKIRLIQTPLADPSVSPIAGSSAYQGLVQSFAKLGFAETHLDDGWALNAHDALTTVIAAVGMISATAEVNPATLHAAIADNFSNQLVPGAIEPLTFDRDGNRTGSPVVVRLCPLADNETRTRTVPVTPGYAGDCP